MAGLRAGNPRRRIYSGQGATVWMWRESAEWGWVSDVMTPRSRGSKGPSPSRASGAAWSCCGQRLSSLILRTANPPPPVGCSGMKGQSLRLALETVAQALGRESGRARLPGCRGSRPGKERGAPGPLAGPQRLERKSKLLRPCKVKRRCAEESGAPAAHRAPLCGARAPPWRLAASQARGHHPASLSSPPFCLSDLPHPTPAVPLECA